MISARNPRSGRTFTVGVFLQDCLARLTLGNIRDGELIMALQQPRLPARFPVGTHYIVEGEPAKGGKLRIVSRYVVMPSGARYDLMTPTAQVRKPTDVT